MQEKIIKTFDNTNLYYKIKRFKNKKPTILFIHGLSGNHTVWKKSFNYFSQKRYSVIALDLHGHGYSYKSRKIKRHSIKNAAKDIKAIIDEEKLTNVVFVGISLGGMIALMYEKEFGKASKKIVLLGTSHSNPLKYGLVPVPWFFIPFFHWGAYLIAVIASYFKPYKWPYLDYSQFSNHNALTIVYHDLHASPISSYFASVVSMFRYNIESYLHKIKKPVLLISGENDSVVRTQASYDIAKHLKHATIKEIKNADHLIPMRFPRKLNSLIEAFISQK